MNKVQRSEQTEPDPIYSQADLFTNGTHFYILTFDAHLNRYNLCALTDGRIYTDTRLDTAQKAGEYAIYKRMTRLKRFEVISLTHMGY